MLLRLERHYKNEQAARQAAEAKLEELQGARSTQVSEIEAQKASVKQVGGIGLHMRFPPADRGLAELLLCCTH